MAMKHDDSEETGDDNQNKEKKGADEDEEDADESSPSSTGGLLQLVEKDLKVLVKHWIGATRDYVLLSLPKHYAPQLPPHGGTFYRYGDTLLVPAFPRDYADGMSCFTCYIPL